MARFMLVNTAPGPRGLQTVAQGVVMVQPSLAGAVNGVEAELNDDEQALAELAGIELRDVADASIVGLQSSNLPGEGQIDFNTEEGQRLHAEAMRAHAEREEALRQPIGNNAGKPPVALIPSPPLNPNDGKTGDELPEVRVNMPVADIEKIAADEGVDLSSATNNEGRVQLITDARAAKAGQ